ncbi:MAG: phosphoribosylamine--glycine ligase [Candidatus Hatepunaea meridiana]|nr:phosphoribosylamine--glycine ligase [Candidatus Hatepunaea meridiana]
MKVLIIGSGGREHTLAWACSRSKLEPEIYCAPGNGGTAGIAENVDLDINISAAVLEYVRDKRIDFTIIGHEVPLVAGLTDMLENNGCLVFGPKLKAANIEGSKSFAKILMHGAGIPTADYVVFSSLEMAKDHIRTIDYKIVVKASGLAAGKGVIICKNADEAISAANAMLSLKKFGKAGEEIVVEERLIGVETSLMAFVDGEDYLLLPPSRDHKRAFDNDQGPNTGGMGAYSPLDDLSSEDISSIADSVFPPILKKIAELGAPYKGLLYAGLMLTDKGFNVLEFNCRFGDPETQVQLPILRYDSLEIMIAVAEGGLSDWMLKNDLKPNDWQKLTRDEYAATVVVAADGYPGSYNKGMKIENLPQETDTVIPFHAGTNIKDGDIITSGGRILAITGLGKTHEEAVKTAYAAINEVKIEGIRYRNDIGIKGNK